jgi:uncharacterized protein YciI
MLYIMYGIDNPAKAHLRAELREKHQAYTEEHKSMVVLSGALLTDDSATPGRMGSVILLNAPSMEAARKFADNEPLAKSGLFTILTVQRVRRGAWLPENAPKTAEGN